jgi:hypothetical protein
MESVSEKKHKMEKKEKLSEHKPAKAIAMCVSMFNVRILISPENFLHFKSHQQQWEYEK